MEKFDNFLSWLVVKHFRNPFKDQKTPPTRDSWPQKSRIWK